MMGMLCGHDQIIKLPLIANYPYLQAPNGLLHFLFLFPLSLSTFSFHFLFPLSLSLSVLFSFQFFLRKKICQKFKHTE